jgi:uncharacterized protein YndB with AHSA1/START domain
MIIDKTISISASPSKVWGALTEPVLIKQWITDAKIDIISTWEVGAPIIYQGDLHGISFENKAMILQFEADTIFKYTFWSSLSEQPDHAENYSVITFNLTLSGTDTTLALTQTGFGTEVIYQHFNFYWNTALHLIKQLCEA